MRQLRTCIAIQSYYFSLSVNRFVTSWESPLHHFDLLFCQAVQLATDRSTSWSIARSVISICVPRRTCSGGVCVGSFSLPSILLCLLFSWNRWF
jgi:hypothetical protein